MADCEVNLVGEEPGQLGVATFDSVNSRSRTTETPVDREGSMLQTGVIAPDGPLSGELSAGSQGGTSDGGGNIRTSSPHPHNSPHSPYTPPQPNGSRNRSTGSSQRSDTPAEVDRERLCEQHVHACARYGNVGALQKLVAERPARASEKDPQGQTPLHFAASYGEVHAMESLLQSNADPQVECVNGWTPLHLAARNGYVECIAALLLAGVDVNATGARDETALHNSAMAGGAEATEKLIASGAELEKVDVDGWTPVHYATRFNNSDCLKCLLEAGAEPDGQDLDGWTAMHNAARNGKNRCVELLIEYKGSLFKKNKLGETPLHIACRKGKNKVVEKIVLEAKRLQQVAQLLQVTDKNGKTAEAVTEFDYIRALIKSEGTAMNARATMENGSGPGELTPGREMPLPATPTARGPRGSGLCTIL